MFKNLFFLFSELLIFNLFVSYLFYLLIIKFAGKRIKSSCFELFIYLLGSGPAVTVWLLNLLLIFFPKNSSLFYFSLILIFYLLIFLIVRKIIIKEAEKILTHLQKYLNTSFFNKILFLIVNLLIIAWIISIIQVPILGHDMFEYATQGKIFFTEKEIKYKKHIFDEKTNFYFVGLHGFAFPLFTTWENILNDIFKNTSDYYLKSITGYYWILIFLIFWHWLSKKNKFLGFFGSLILILTPGFTYMFAFYHIDTYRIFFLISSLIFLYYLFSFNDNMWLLLLGIYGGIAVNAHTLNVILIFIFLLSYLIFSSFPFKKRLLQILFIFLLLLIFGGYHYILDILIGTGWVFKEFFIN